MTSAPKPDNRTNNQPNLKSFRKDLRSNLTPAEAKLWSYLQSSKLENRKFRRQHSIENYILDFYCPSEKIAIELDGDTHNTLAQREADKTRDQFLNSIGIKVLRFENKMVFENSNSILNAIKKEFGWQKNEEK